MFQIHSRLLHVIFKLTLEEFVESQKFRVSFDNGISGKFFASKVFLKRCFRIKWFVFVFRAVYQVFSSSFYSNDIVNMTFFFFVVDDAQVFYKYIFGKFTHCGSSTHLTLIYIQTSITLLVVVMIVPIKILLPFGSRVQHLFNIDFFGPFHPNK